MRKLEPIITMVVGRVTPDEIASIISATRTLVATIGRGIEVEYYFAPEATLRWVTILNESTLVTHGSGVRACRPG